MTPSHRCCFVLWGEQCDEAAAALFVTTLRAAGLRVWVVGISGKRIGGVHGLQLIADLALDQALPLADDAICVVVPCRVELLARFLHDPRLRTFLETTLRQASPLLLAQRDPPAHAASPLPELGFPFAPEVPTFYPPGEALLPFIQAFAATLSASLY